MGLQINFEAVTNREDWVDTFEVRDQNDALFDLSTATIVFSVRCKTSKREMLHAVVGAGITLGDLGFFTVTFTEQQMRGLSASLTYEVGCTIARDGNIKQYFTGQVPIMDGIVP